MGVSGMGWKYRTARKSFKTTDSGLQALFAGVATSVTGLARGGFFNAVLSRYRIWKRGLHPG